jgi:CheY-like chemotaxis protein
MLIEDSRGDQILFEHALSQLPNTVTLLVCNDREEAEKVLAQQNFDLIFMDLNLRSELDINKVIAFIDKHSASSFVLLTGTLTDQILQAFDDRPKVLGVHSKDELNSDLIARFL